MAIREKTHTVTRDYAKVGEYLRRLRMETGLTQNEVSKMLGYASAQYISNFECGLTTPPLRKLKMMMEIYHGDARYLISLIVESEKNILDNAFSLGFGATKAI